MFYRSFKLFLVRNPWALGLLALVYVIILRGTVAYADEGNIISKTAWALFAPKQIKDCDLPDPNESDNDLLYGDRVYLPILSDLAALIAPRDIELTNRNEPSVADSSDAHTQTSAATFADAQTQTSLDLSGLDAKTIHDAAFMSFLNTLENNAEKAMNINTELHNQISEAVGVNVTITEARLKKVVQDVMLNHVSKPLWLNNDILADPFDSEKIPMLMYDDNTAFNMQNQTGPDRKIFHHITVHLYIIIKAHQEHQDVILSLNDDIYYQQCSKQIAKSYEN